MSLRRLTLFLSVFFTAAVGPAASAFAHHVDVTATVDCAGTVTATATSWAGDANDPVALDLQRTNTGATLSVDGSTVASGPLTKANGYSITGSRLVAGAPGTVVPVTVEYGAFGNGSAGGSRATSVTLTDGCAPPPPAPANPAATVGEVVCASGGATVSLSNTGGVAATIVVSRDGVTTDTVTVAPGGSAQSLVTIAEDATVTIAATTSGGTQLVSRTLTLDCVPAPPAPAAPAATVGDVSCADFGAVVTLTNTGGTPVTFTVVRDAANVATVSVAGGATATQAVPIAENATATITVSAPGMPDVTRTLTRDCLTAPAPAVTVGTVDCINGGAFVNLVNTGGESATFTITRDAVTFDAVTVTGNGTGSRLVPITEDTTATISVAAAGMTTVTATVMRDCVPAGPTASNTTPPTTTTPTTTTPIAAPATPTAVDANPTDVEAANLEPVGAEATPSDSNDTAPVAAEAVVTPTSTETAGGTLPFTGAGGTLRLALAGVLLLLAGLASSMVGRRRSERFVSES